MKIKKTDLMWKAYARCYRGQYDAPHPRNLCRYFWKSLFGVTLWLFSDLRVLVFPAIVGACIWLLAYGIICDDTLSCLGGLACFFVVAIYVGFCVNYWMDKCKKHNLEGLPPILVVAVALYVAFCIGGHKIFPGSHPMLAGLYVLLMVAGGSIAVAVVVISIMAYFGSSFGKATVEYAKAAKSRMCPLIEIEED